jgi:hypothetical protein
LVLITYSQHCCGRSIKYGCVALGLPISGL